MKVPKDQQRGFLIRLAHQAMLDRGLIPDFSKEAIAEVDQMDDGPFLPKGEIRDLRSMLWCSIDNDDSRDLDQLTVAEDLGNGRARILVAVADVSALVKSRTAVDRHAGANTTSVYTPPQNFPMLPERLSTDLTSLIQDADRPAMIVQMEVEANGSVGASSVLHGIVKNRAKLAYSSVAAWLENKGPMPAALQAVQGLAENLKLQDRVAQALKSLRHEHGALALDTLQVRADFQGDTISGLTLDERNRAHTVIEDFMIAANGVIARFLQDRNFPVVRRIVRSPERWQRIVQLAEQHGTHLPEEPDAKALNEFLLQRRNADPVGFPDLSLAVIKLLGRGEYVATFPGQDAFGHFGLAVNDYTHSTAPNRRYPDLITQRLVKACLTNSSQPYSHDELIVIANRCTLKENDAQKVERFIRKAAAALWLGDSIGKTYDGIITGASSKGTWVRILDPVVEGRLEQGYQGLDVGDRVRVRLTHTDPQRGFIDFARA